MRAPWADSKTTVEQHRSRHGQVDTDAPEARLPPYLESFLAHLRMLVGVPFRYLVPDERLLPKESVRFFYVDRSWTDRVVDGALAVGKIGTREMAHHHKHGRAVRNTLDVAQRMVRRLQRGKVPGDYRKLVDPQLSVLREERPVTGILLRSALVSGWPHMDIRAYDWPDGTGAPEAGFDPAADLGAVTKLDPLRIERLSPSVLIALFDGEPKLVMLEQPPHGIQFGVDLNNNRPPTLHMRRANGVQITPFDDDMSVDVEFRAGGRQVVDVMKLRNALHRKATPPSDPAVPQLGSAQFAVAVLSPPFRQRFEGTEDERNNAPAAPGGGMFEVSGWVSVALLRAKVVEALTDGS